MMAKAVSAKDKLMSDLAMLPFHAVRVPRRSRDPAGEIMNSVEQAVLLLA